MQQRTDEQRTDTNFRYDYFTIWSPGLKHRSEILDIVGADGKFEIVEMVDHRPSDLAEFLGQLYIYDSIPKGHIHRKIGRITAEGPDMAILFVKHHDPDFVATKSSYVEGAICWKSRHIGDLKMSIRRRFVPGDNVWAIDVFHGSDFEEQVDHLLKMLGHEEGIAYLYSRYGRPDPIPGTFGNSNFAPPQDCGER